EGLTSPCVMNAAQMARRAAPSNSGSILDMLDKTDSRIESMRGAKPEERRDVDATLRVLANNRPLAGGRHLTSRMEIRIDPLLGVPAMPTGTDAAGTPGEPVSATGPGRVTMAGWNGAYGKMVEIDHGNGVVTRYGHLSELNVKE